MNYPLQDFRVHEVEPGTPSTITPDTVVIVIDVGDSDLAPHQCAHNKVYYYRAGGRSEPASHFYLQMLSRRDVYPGPDTARAWFDTVINPLLGRFKNERDCLDKERWSWGRYGGNLQELTRISALMDEDLAFNLEQIIESHPNLKPLLIEHDERVVGLYHQVEKLFNDVNESAVLHELYTQLVSTQALMAVKEMGAFRLSQCNTDQEILNTLFGHSATDLERQAWLAQEIVNKSGELPDNIGHALIWNTHKEKLLALLDHPSLQVGIQRLQEAKDLSLQVIDQLTKEFKQLRQELALRFRIPYVSSDNVRPPMGSQLLQGRHFY